MQYTVAHIHYNSQKPYQRELVQQALADIGFEAFDGDDAYIQTSLLDEQQVAETLEGTDYTLETCPDENWNATWEAEHEPEELPLGVTIIPHCAFGAGHHETTSMMISALIRSEKKASTVLDMGTGTGVLGIFAAKMGAENVLAVDIDDKATANALENAERNGVRLDVLTQSTVPTTPTPEIPYAGHYDLILANIHRNILLAQMEDYASTLNDNGQLWLSGFYEEDIPALLDGAAQYGLHLLGSDSCGDWQMLRLARLA